MISFFDFESNRNTGLYSMFHVYYMRIKGISDYTKQNAVLDTEAVRIEF